MGSWLAGGLFRRAKHIVRLKMDRVPNFVNGEVTTKRYSQLLLRPKVSLSRGFMVCITFNRISSNRSFSEVENRTVVTMELFKQNAARIPNICRHFNVRDLVGILPRLARLEQEDQQRVGILEDMAADLALVETGLVDAVLCAAQLRFTAFGD
jgi:hypothetical protein